MTDPAYWDAIQRLQSQENQGPPLTLREHLEAIRDDLKAMDDLMVAHAKRAQSAHGHYVAALKALDEAEVEFDSNPRSTHIRRLVIDEIVPDPAPST